MELKQKARRHVFSQRAEIVSVCIYRYTARRLVSISVILNDEHLIAQCSIMRHHSLAFANRMVVVAGIMLSSIHWDFWWVLSLRMMASRSLLHSDYGRSGHIAARPFELLGEESLILPVASLMSYPKAEAPGSADSRLWSEEM